MFNKINDLQRRTRDVSRSPDNKVELLQYIQETEVWPDNEKADELARAGGDTKFCGPEPEQLGWPQLRTVPLGSLQRFIRK